MVEFGEGEELALYFLWGGAGLDFEDFVVVAVVGGFARERGVESGGEARLSGLGERWEGTVAGTGSVKRWGTEWAEWHSSFRVVECNWYDVEVVYSVM